MKKAILTVVGKNQVGIIARVTTLLASDNVNVLDITQTIIDGYFNMMVICDITSMEKEFSALAEELTETGRELGVAVKLQRSEIFEKMQRV